MIVHELSLISQKNVPDLVSPYAMYASAKDEFELFESDVRLSKILTISNFEEED